MPMGSDRLLTGVYRWSDWRAMKRTCDGMTRAGLLVAKDEGSFSLFAGLSSAFSSAFSSAGGSYNHR